MMRINHDEAPRIVGFIGFLARVGYLFLMSIYFGIRSFWGYDTAWPSDNDVYAISIFGWATIFSIFYIYLHWYKRVKSNNLGFESFIVGTNLLFVSLLYISMVAYRTLNLSETTGINAYLVGGRYIIFPSLFIFLFTFLCVTRLRVTTKEYVFFSTGFLLISIISNFFFVRNVLPHVWPWMKVNHFAVWAQYVKESKELLDSGKDLKDFRPTSQNSNLDLTLRSHQNLLVYSIHEFESRNHRNLLPKLE